LNIKPLAKLISTFFYCGYFPVARGTFASLITVAIIWFLIPPFYYILIPISIGLFIISVWSATIGEEFFGKDGKPIVIDEVTGMVISLIFVPYGFLSYAGAFLLFRFFDVIKPPPAAWAEKFKAGWGVTLDDVFAGIYANICMQLILYILRIIR
jgi:phosphatidylglycerophosphatase A